MEKSCKNEQPLRRTLVEMAVGDVVSFPIRRISVVRSTVSTLNLELGRQYTSRTNRNDSTVDVTRMA